MFRFPFSGKPLIQEIGLPIAIALTKHNFSKDCSLYKGYTLPGNVPYITKTWLEYWYGPVAINLWSPTGLHYADFYLIFPDPELSPAGVTLSKEERINRLKMRIQAIPNIFNFYLLCYQPNIWNNLTPTYLEYNDENLNFLFNKTETPYKASYQQAEAINRQFCYLLKSCFRFRGHVTTTKLSSLNIGHSSSFNPNNAPSILPI